MVKRYACLILVALLLAGCSGNSPVETPPETAPEIPVVGIFLPDSLWKPEADIISQALTKAGYQVIVQYANGDPQAQQQQVETRLGGSVDLLIICPIDSIYLADALQQATKKNIPVLAYDRMLMHSPAVSACVATDTYAAGNALGQYILDTIQPQSRETPATMELLMGSPENNNAFLFHSGLMAALQTSLDSGKLTVLSGRKAFEDTCVPNANPISARVYLLDYLLEYYGETLPDILIAGGTGMAQQFQSIYPEEAIQLPLLVGLEEKAFSEGMSAYAYFDRTLLADTCIQWAILLLEKQAIPQGTTQSNGVIDVPTYLLKPTTQK